MKELKIVRDQRSNPQFDIQNQIVDRIRKTSQKIDHFQVQVKDKR